MADQVTEIKNEEEEVKEVKGEENQDDQDKEAELQAKKDQEAKDTELEELRDYKTTTETNNFLVESGVKENARPYVSQLIKGQENKDKIIKELQKNIPEIFKSKGTNIAGELNKPNKNEVNEDKENAEIEKMKRQVGG